MRKGWMYILECCDGSYYTGSTNNLEIRLYQHQNGEGANHTKKRLPVKLVYCEEYDRIDEAFYREKQIQGWSRKKKEALINGAFDKLKQLSKNYTQYPSGESSVPMTSTSSVSGKEYSPMPELVEGKTTLASTPLSHLVNEQPQKEKSNCSLSETETSNKKDLL